MFCPNCGNQIPDNALFCGNCGAKIEPKQQERQTPPQQEPPVPPQTVIVQQPVTEATLPAQYRPLSPWAYFGYSLLFQIPIIGFILLIVFSCKKSNINRRNFARSYWCALVLCVIVIAIFCIIAVATGTFDRLLYQLRNAFRW